MTFYKPLKGVLISHLAKKHFRVNNNFLRARPSHEKLHSHKRWSNHKWLTIQKVDFVAYYFNNIFI